MDGVLNLDVEGRMRGDILKLLNIYKEKIQERDIEDGWVGSYSPDYVIGLIRTIESQPYRLMSMWALITLGQIEGILDSNSLINLTKSRGEWWEELHKDMVAFSEELDKAKKENSSEDEGEERDLFTGSRIS